MKITGLTGVFGLLKQVQGKREDGESSGQNPHEHRQPKKRQGEGPETPDDEKITAAQVADAIVAFQADAQAQSSGISATIEGEGNALRVALRDAEGRVIRQLTREEFVKIRQATSKDQRARGKILDQKF